MTARPVTEVPMFPLGTVLFPTLPLPLRVFEDRYRTMTKLCLAGDGRFGVVLIERGFEVGGGDQRFGVGTVATIVDSAELPDGGFNLLAVGGERVAVREWLPEEPFPRARVERIPPPATSPATADLIAAATQLLRRGFALRAELGEPAPPATIDLATDPLVAPWQLAFLSPLGPLDKQRLLEIPDHDDRLSALQSLLVDDLDVLARRASGG